MWEQCCKEWWFKESLHNNRNGAHHRSRNFLKAKDVPKQTAISKSLKTLVNLIYTLSAMLKKWWFKQSLHNNWNGAHHRIRNFGKSRNVQNNQQFRKVWQHCKSNIHCAHIVGNDWSKLLFAIVSMVRITGVEIS